MKRNCDDRDDGFTLIELLIVIAIIGILASVASLQIYDYIRHLRVKDCASKLAADIKQARAATQTEGQRAQLVLTNDTESHDFDNSGANELWLTFLDTNRNMSFDPGETILSTGTCDQVFVETTTGLNACPQSNGVNNLCMWFTTLGTLRPDPGTGESNINFTYMQHTSYKVRVQVVSVIGHTIVQSCSAADCGADSGGWTDI